VDHVMLPIRTILYPAGYSEHSEYAFTDYSEHSEYAFQAACELARNYGARLIVLHVLHTAESPRPRGDGRQGGSCWSGNDRDSPQKELYRLKSPDPAVRLEHRLREGSPAAEILRTADEDRCDLIVMGMHGRTGLDRVRMGSVVEEVLRRARCPVLAVRSPPARQPREWVWAEYGLGGVLRSRASRGCPGSVMR
jgi:nucleotide-binding universal stress UspA family protein